MTKEGAWIGGDLPETGLFVLDICIAKSWDSLILGYDGIV